jgi:hypothetical protein
MHLNLCDDSSESNPPVTPRPLVKPIHASTDSTVFDDTAIQYSGRLKSTNASQGVTASSVDDYSILLPQVHLITLIR